jgi:hypothetical protein
MENNIGYYLALLALIIIGFIVVKKVASCMIKSVVGIILILAAAAIYWLYLK